MPSPRRKAVSGPAEVRPHDLLRLRSADAAGETCPSWVTESLRRAPWVVVRRAHPRPGWLAVGVRGDERSRRFAMDVAPMSVDRIVGPEDLRRVAVDEDRQSLPALALFARVAPVLAAFDVAWGPTGSVGFELAAGVATVAPDSDLDVVVRCPEPLPLHRAQALERALLAQAGRAGCRIDVQLDTPAGGVALAELAQGGSVLLRTGNGPRLVVDPWEQASSGAAAEANLQPTLLA